MRILRDAVNLIYKLADNLGIVDAELEEDYGAREFFELVEDIAEDYE